MPYSEWKISAENSSTQTNRLGALENALISRRYNGDKWYEFNGSIVHEVRNTLAKESLSVVLHEYLIWQCQPQMHKIRVYSNG